jgi:putative ATP-dependent endonuclease of OLD family
MFSKLIEKDYHLVESLYKSIEEGSGCTRIRNLEHTRNGQQGIFISKAYKTLEYEIALANVSAEKDNFKNNRFITYIKDSHPQEFSYIETYLSKFNKELDFPARKKVALLLWKLMPGKADFAQDFARHLHENLLEAKNDFSVPKYIQQAFDHLKGCL